MKEYLKIVWRLYMSFETKEDILKKILKMEKPYCPHCNERMKLWEVPPINVGDGLGWGTPYLFMCFNDKCELYEQGWKNIFKNYAHNASYRCINFPGTNTYELIPVFSPVGGAGQLIDEKMLVQEAEIKNNIKRGFSVLTDCYLNKDAVSVLQILMDSTEPAKVRIKAAEILADIGEIEIIEPIASLKLDNVILQNEINRSIQKIYTRFYVQECPFCAEIIKNKAKFCKHCKQDITKV